MYLSFYVTDSNNGLIFQYLPSASAPTYSNFIIKLKSIYQDTDINSLSEFQISKYLKSFKYHSQQNNLDYWCLTSEENKDTSRVKNVALIDPYVFMEGIDELLMEYFDKEVLTIKKLTNNYDRLTMIFNYIIDDGEPRLGAVMYSNKVRDVIPLQKDLTKFISSTAKNITDVVSTTTASDLRGGFQPGTFGNSSRGRVGIDRDAGKALWRSATKEMYTKEELYLDFVESVHLVLQKHHHRHKGSKKRLSRSGYINNSLNSSQLTIVHGYIHGSIEGHSLLNGTPTVELNLNNNGTTIDTPSFHDCVNCDDYINDNEGKKLLNTKVTFIPPDGKFHLMDYSVGLDGIASNNIGLISVNFENNLGINNDEFEVSVNIGGSVKVPSIKNLVVDLSFVEDMLSSDDRGSIANSVEHSDQYKIKIINNTHGRFSSGIEWSTGKWIFDSVTPTGTIAVLRGCVENTDDVAGSDDNGSHNSSEAKAAKKTNNHKVLHSVDIRYEHEGQLVSGIKVNSIEVTKANQSVNPKMIFKGVKYISRMKECEIREN